MGCHAKFPEGKTDEPHRLSSRRATEGGAASSGRLGTEMFAEYPEARSMETRADAVIHSAARAHVIGGPMVAPRSQAQFLTPNNRGYDRRHTSCL
jgi:hypothetical protein